MIPILYFAGIGSRATPAPTLSLMKELAYYLASLGYRARSGRALGADTAFEEAYNECNAPIDIWLPWKGFNKFEGIGYYPNEKHFEIAKTLHPIWDKLPRWNKFLHARNVGQILGSDLTVKSKFVLCWTPDGCETHETRTKKTGGTGTAISLASQYGIPIFNLFNEDAIDRLFDYLKNHLHYPNRFNSFYDETLRPELPEGMIYVFGSNLAGIHGAGAALEARKKYGAIIGQGIGLQNSAYGLPTKDNDIKQLPLRDIIPYVHEFVDFTCSGERTFYLTPVGCGLAGYEAKDIAPHFRGSQYCQFPMSWMEYLI